MEKGQTFINLDGAIANKKLEIASTARELRSTQERTQYLAQLLLEQVAELENIEYED